RRVAVRANEALVPHYLMETIFISIVWRPTPGQRNSPVLNAVRTQMAQVNLTRWLSTVAIGLIALTGCSGGGSTQSRAITGVAPADSGASVPTALPPRPPTVKPTLPGPPADPPTSRATPADAAALTDASLVVFNGGGYDSWVDDVLAKNSKIQPVDAFSF